MTLKTYKVSNRAEFFKDLDITRHKLRERVIIGNIKFDNVNKVFIIEVEASDKFHSELTKLGYTAI
jgi:hypothetical protein